MAIRINRILIKDFKLFDKLELNFNDPDLVMFDGPNGFGKTSFYDAIELLFTGNLRRYKELVRVAVDKRESFKGNPLLNDLGRGDLVIKCELQTDDNKICLMRIGKRKELESAKSFDEFKLQLYVSQNYEADEEYLKVNDEEKYLTGLLGTTYKENFEFLNYIEQEDNIYLLKNKDRDRKSAIGYLFNTIDFEENINKISEISKKITELCGKKASDNLKVLSAKLDDYRIKFHGVEEKIPYTKLVTWKDITWDYEKLELSDEKYIELLAKDGELSRISLFLENESEFRKDVKNKRIDEILSKKNLLSQLLNCWNHIDRTLEFSKKQELNQAINNLLFIFDGDFLDWLIQNKAYLSTQVQELIKPNINLDEYDKAVGSIISINNRADLISKILVEVKDSRQAFINKYFEFENKSDVSNECPLCGFLWKSSEELKNNIIKQEQQLENLIETAGSELNESIDSFKKLFITPMRLFFKEYLENNNIDAMFIEELKKADKNRIELNKLYNDISSLDIDINNLLNKKPFLPDENMIEILYEKIEAQKYVINTNLLKTYFYSIFIHIFDEDFNNISLLQKTDIDKKRKYLEWQYSIQQSNEIRRLEKEYSDQIIQFDCAKLFKDKIDKLSGIYKESLQNYQRSLIKNIEILFHIYSGRINQESQSGLGLFIESDKNGIRFLENHSKQHDAIFTMSSGQLAALVISFTLALNKRYSRNKLLFIDDPVQTLDELNIAGMVELLRNEFSDRQIFISTHEDTMSAYIRYKFNKYGFHTERFSFKDIQFR